MVNVRHIQLASFDMITVTCIGLVVAMTQTIWTIVGPEAAPFVKAIVEVVLVTGERGNRREETGQRGRLQHAICVNSLLLDLLVNVVVIATVVRRGARNRKYK